ncbi:MAG TPA: DUF2630 family protein [Casimicrobiaceae bacterium]|jgi:hypothetical protein|nr:DUF2630 family protein [Casimicrobiaceae bacterium]
MADPTQEAPVLARIQRLVEQEHALREKSALSAIEKQQLASLEVDLDQCWDLLRQRRALREFGQSPSEAHVRPADVVEKYEG